MQNRYQQIIKYFCISQQSKCLPLLSCAEDNCEVEGRVHSLF